MLIDGQRKMGGRAIAVPFFDIIIKLVKLSVILKFLLNNVIKIFTEFLYFSNFMRNLVLQDLSKTLKFHKNALENRDCRIYNNKK